MFQTFRNAWKIPDLRKKILFTLLIIIVYRLGACIPVPWVNSESLSEIFELNTANTMFTYINLLSGDAFGKATLFALSVSPYITASIVIQLLTIAIPALERLSKDGENGKKVINKITRWLTLVLAIVTALGYAMYLKNGMGSTSMLNVAVDAEGNLTGMGYFEMIVIIACFCAGASIIMWLGEKIDQYGIGNGISIILFANIIARLPDYVKTVYAMCIQVKSTDKVYSGTKTGLELALGILAMIGIIVVVIALVYFVVWFTNSERRIPIQYAKRVVGRKMYGGQNSNLPLKMNMAGVMPIIFANSIVAIPATIASFFPNNSFWKGVNEAFNYQSWAYLLVFIALNIAFSYFYIMISFNPVEVANNIKNNGGAIPGIRPGRATIDFIKRTLNRVTFIGAIFLCIVAGLPMVVNIISNGELAELAFGGSSLLIIVGVALETARELESQMTMRNYKGFLD